MVCPKCGTTNADGVQFCTNCHATLFFKCPKCEHIQSHSDVCEKCGTSFALFWSSYLTDRFAEDHQLEHDKLRAEGVAVLQAATLPFSASQGLSRFFFWQVLNRAVAFFRSR
jgi:hypothetical protein